MFKNFSSSLFFNKLYGNRAHLFHIVTVSPWPYILSWGIFFFLLGFACYMHGYAFDVNFFSASTYGILILLGGIPQWARDIIREGTFQGRHSQIVQTSLRIGFCLFILSEVLFFFSFFWAFFHTSLSPTPVFGCVWPPKNLPILDPWSIPFANTLILLYSGISITFVHHSLVNGGSEEDIFLGFIFTLIAAYVFIALQFFEYTEASFSINDGAYGSVFFLTTGFHGAHVIIGSILILICFERTWAGHFTKKHMVGFETSAWYWHFVDVVWLFVFTFFYWWSGILN
jgi:heme/copper-type cytochrome/quinol oxidase subunit 3